MGYFHEVSTAMPRCLGYCSPGSLPDSEQKMITTNSLTFSEYHVPTLPNSEGRSQMTVTRQDGSIPRLPRRERQCIGPARPVSTATTVRALTKSSTLPMLHIIRKDPICIIV